MQKEATVMEKEIKASFMPEKRTILIVPRYGMTHDFLVSLSA
jgi:hypothetical protein